MPRKKCPGNWTVGGSLADKSSTKAILLWISWRDQWLARSLPLILPLPFPLCDSASLSSPLLPRFTVFARQLTTAPTWCSAASLTEQALSTPSHDCHHHHISHVAATAAHSHCVLTLRTRSCFSSASIAMAACSFADGRDTQPATAWKLCPATNKSLIHPAWFAAHTLHLLSWCWQSAWSSCGNTVPVFCFSVCLSFLSLLSFLSHFSKNTDSFFYQ